MTAIKTGRVIRRLRCRPDAAGGTLNAHCGALLVGGNLRCDGGYSAKTLGNTMYGAIAQHGLCKGWISDSSHVGRQVQRACAS